MSERSLDIAQRSTLLAAPTVYAAVESPLRVVLGYPIEGSLWWLDWAVTLAFAWDFAASLRTKPRRGGDPGAVGAGRSPGGLIADLLVLVPAVLVLPGALALPAALAATLRPLCLLRILRLRHFGRLSERLHRGHRLHPSLLRLFSFLFWLSLSAHWIACGWLALRSRGVVAGVAAERYFDALYWCVTTLTTVGYGDVAPRDRPEKAYAMMVMVLGVGVYGYVIGSVAGLLRDLDAARSRYREKLGRVQALMSYRGVPRDLQRRVRSYYTHLWDSRLGFEEGELSDLPPGLRAEVAFELHRPVLSKVPYLDHAPEELLRELALAVRAVVSTPGEEIVRRGEHGTTMFMVSNGAVEVLDPDGGVLRRLGEGDVFGEIALLGGAPRTATVRAVGFCNLYVLDQESFDRALDRHPRLARELRTLARERQKSAGGAAEL